AGTAAAVSPPPRSRPRRSRCRGPPPRAAAATAATSTRRSRAAAALRASRHRSCAQAEVRGLGHEHVALHPVVDVAAQRHHPGLVEHDRVRRHALVERDLEGPGGREGIDVVAELIEVWEGDLGADRRDDAELVRCWYAPDNFERLERVREFAAGRGVQPIHVALAFVLHQPFPTFPLIGPRTPEETSSSFRALTLTLTPQECAWLNLETDAVPV
ncbi:MAG: aldo/keto reductase, partial [Pleurocapsa sp. SU_196_0]|nr:aldo/keto reductase [Pleurocapsa sp. SU_196_0]